MTKWTDCVGPGWRHIVEPLINLAHVKNIQVTQVKEKFGTLRFYTDNTDDDFYRLVCNAEDLSAQTCEQCGKPGSLRTDSGWMKTRCDEHA